VEAQLKAKFWTVGVALFLVFCVAPASALAGSISGRVTNAATGLPKGEVTVCAEPAGGGSGQCIGVSESGEYTLEGLETAEYKVSFQPYFETNYVRQYYPGTLYYEDATVISLDASEAVTGIDAAIVEGATISGTVVGEGAAGPLEEVEVCAKEVGGPGYEYCGWTGSDGTYRIVGIPAGTYPVVFKSFLTGVEYATRYYDEKNFDAEADEVELEAGQEFTADATMVGAGAIEGIVTEAGRPREFASVCVYTLAEVKVGCSNWTEEDGAYRLEDLPVGSYVLEAEFFGETLLFSGGAKTFAEATPVTVTAGGTTVEDLAIPGPPGISGTVLDAATGEAPEGVVYACASGDNGSTCWQIDGDGTYQITGLEPGEYVVSFESGTGAYIRQFYDGVGDENEATRVTVGDSMVTGIDGELEKAGMITGHVTLAGAGTNLGSVNACALDQGGTVVECITSSSSTGNYTIRELPPGEYTVRFTKNGYGTQYYDGKAKAAEAEAVTVTGGATTGSIDAAMVASPKNTVKPQLSGVAKVGEVLSCSQGTWSNSPSAFEYFWFRGIEEIEGAEASTYAVTAADAGKTLRCGVLAESPLGGAAFAESSNSLEIPAARRLSVSKGGDGSGTVTSSPAGIDCGQTCSFGAYQGDRLALTATPAPHSEFSGWSGECSGAGSCEVTLGAADASVTAIFTQITHPLSVAVSGAGSVSAAGGTISGCTESGGTCSGTYDEGTEVTLTATPDAHHQLSGWTGCDSESGGECVVSVDGAENVTATFVPIAFRLGVTKSGEGSGTVTSSPPGIECGATCAADFDEGTSVTLTAVPDPGSEFTGWSGGGCSGTATCSVTLGEATGVVAGFAKKRSEVGDDGGGNGGGSGEPTSPGPSGSTNPSDSTPPAPKPVTEKPLKCKKGFRKEKRKGKTRCVKVKPKRKGGKAKGRRD
jgi:hypothetical protein